MRTWLPFSAPALVVVFVLTYMAFIVPSVNIKAAQDGKIDGDFRERRGCSSRMGDKLYSLEVVKKKWVNNVMEEKTAVAGVHLQGQWQGAQGLRHTG